MENKDIFLVSETAPTWRWRGGGFWGKNVEKNENLTCRGDFWKKKTKN